MTTAEVWQEIEAGVQHMQRAFHAHEVVLPALAVERVATWIDQQPMAAAVRLAPMTTLLHLYVRDVVRADGRAGDIDIKVTGVALHIKAKGVAYNGGWTTRFTPRWRRWMKRCTNLPIEPVTGAVLRQEWDATA